MNWYAIAGVIIAAIVLVIVLAVLLSRKKESSGTDPGGPSKPTPGYNGDAIKDLLDLDKAQVEEKDLKKKYVTVYSKSRSGSCSNGHILGVGCIESDNWIGIGFQQNIQDLDAAIEHVLCFTVSKDVDWELENGELKINDAKAGEKIIMMLETTFLEQLDISWSPSSQSIIGDATGVRVEALDDWVGVGANLPYPFFNMCYAFPALGFYLFNKRSPFFLTTLYPVIDADAYRMNHDQDHLEFCSPGDRSWTVSPQTITDNGAFYGTDNAFFSLNATAPLQKLDIRAGSWLLLNGKQEITGYTEIDPKKALWNWTPGPPIPLYVKGVTLKFMPNDFPDTVIIENGFMDPTKLTVSLPFWTGTATDVDDYMTVVENPDGTVTYVASPSVISLSVTLDNVTKLELQKITFSQMTSQKGVFTVDKVVTFGIADPTFAYGQQVTTEIKLDLEKYPYLTDYTECHISSKDGSIASQVCTLPTGTMKWTAPAILAAIDIDANVKFGDLEMTTMFQMKNEVSLVMSVTSPIIASNQEQGLSYTFVDNSAIKVPDTFLVKVTSDAFQPLDLVRAGGTYIAHPTGPIGKTVTFSSDYFDAPLKVDTFDLTGEVKSAPVTYQQVNDGKLTAPFSVKNTSTVSWKKFTWVLDSGAATTVDGLAAGATYSGTVVLPVTVGKDFSGILKVMDVDGQDTSSMPPFSADVKATYEGDMTVTNITSPTTFGYDVSVIANVQLNTDQATALKGYYGPCSLDGGALTINKPSVQIDNGSFRLDWSCNNNPTLTIDATLVVTTDRGIYQTALHFENVRYSLKQKGPIMQDSKIQTVEFAFTREPHPFRDDEALQFTVKCAMFEDFIIYSNYTYCTLIQHDTSDYHNAIDCFINGANVGFVNISHMQPTTGSRELPQPEE